MFNIGVDNYKVQVKDYATGKFKVVSLHEKRSLPLFAQNMGIIYKRFADGKVIPSFKDVVQKHEFLDAAFASNKDSGLVQSFKSRKWEPLPRH
jgi:hypothetical protein